MSGSKARYGIAAAARMSSLPIDTIRAWERRYDIVTPARDEAQARLYSDDDIARLRLARSVTKLGHPIRRVARMSNAQLHELVRREPPTEPAGHETIVQNILDAVRDYDTERAEQLLISARLLLSARELVLDVLSPLLREIGAEWALGKVAIWQEHLVSALIRKIAGTAGRSAGSGPSMLFATPPFEQHEFGISLAALLATAHGRATYFLGACVPVDNITDAAHRLDASIVVVGMTQSVTAAKTAREFAVNLDASLASSKLMWLGGTLGSQVASQLQGARVHGVPTLEEFDLLCRTA